jgi:hypothetical protein
MHFLRYCCTLEGTLNRCEELSVGVQVHVSKPHLRWEKRSPPAQSFSDVSFPFVPGNPDDLVAPIMLHIKTTQRGPAERP